MDWHEAPEATANRAALPIRRGFRSCYSESMAPKRHSDSEELAVAKSREKLDKPPLFKVLLHNDNYTTMEFVVFALVSIFNKTEDEAFRIMLNVHNEGIGVAGVYTFEIAETKAQKTMDLAREQEYPLMCTVQEA